MKISEVVTVLDQFAPPHGAEHWDNNGLLVGDPARRCRTVLVALDVTVATLAEARARRAQLLVTHHPAIFQPIEHLRTDSGQGALIASAIKANIALYACHTSLDAAPGGTNDVIADLLKLEKRQPLQPTEDQRWVKLVVFTPPADLHAVSKAIFDAGGGKIGEYSACSFREGGIGTFKGSKQSNPTIGRPERLEYVHEWRLEIRMPASRVAQAVIALRHAHSYEEPAFDIYPLVDRDGISGIGRVGDIPNPMGVAAIIKLLGRKLKTNVMGVSGPTRRRIQRIAICTGAGSDLLDDARRAGAEMLITGELRHHHAIDAEQSGITVLVAGHYPTERIGMDVLAQRLARRAALKVITSRRERDPLQWKRTR